jgi:glyoxylate/hydroxypyruvate reductase A
MTNIVFISDLSTIEQKAWLTRLNDKLIVETIRLPHQINDIDALSIDIAIVANPNPDIISRFPNLVWIQSLWAGVERLVASGLPVDVQLVRLIDPQLAKTMAESVVAWTLYLQRQMPRYTKQQQNGVWHQLPTIPSSELRVSILGAGELGLAALKLLNHFDYQLNCWTRSAKNIEKVTNYTGTDGLSNMLGTTDILISLLPLTPDTHHLLNHDLLSQLPHNAQVINFSRGANIDTIALIKLHDADHLSHAVLDVFEVEPLPVDSALWQHEKITVLPHISAPTNLNSATNIVVNNIEKYRQCGHIPPVTNLNKGY